MRRLDKPYKFFLKRHYLALKMVLIAILLLEAVLIGREIVIKDPKVEGIKIQEDASRETITAQPSPTITPQNKPAGGDTRSVMAVLSSPSPSVEVNLKKDTIYTDSGYFRYFLQPYMKEYSGKNVKVSKGTIKFKVTPDWGENAQFNHRTLVLANFNGEGYRNLFEITGTQTELIFDTYDNAAFNGADEPNYFMGHDYIGKTYDVKFRWDFTGDPVKQIFINGVLAVETRPEAKPTETNNKIYIGPVTDLEILDYWEE